MLASSGVNSWLFSGQYNPYSPSVKQASSINETFRGGVTGYNPPQKMNPAQSTLSAQSANEYMSALSEFGRKLQTAAGDFMSRQKGSLFNGRSVTASNSEAITASALAGTKEGTTKQVTVHQVASAQRNEGQALNATAINQAGAGRHSFSIEKDGKEYSYSVNINATDSNRTAQQKMADAINRDSKSGITASVEYNEKDKTSTLVLTGHATGGKFAFSISDENGGGLVAATGIDRVTQEASDAVYTVDGTIARSEKNTVDLGDGITANFTKPTEEPVTLTVKKDVSEITDSVKNFVNEFNNLLDTAKSYNSDSNFDIGAMRLQERLQSTAKAYSGVLKNIGITQDSGGSLVIDSEKLASAAENGSVQRALGNNSNFTSTISRTAKGAEAYQYISNASKLSANRDTDSLQNMYKYLENYQNTFSYQPQDYVSTLLGSM